MRLNGLIVGDLVLNVERPPSPLPIMPRKGPWKPPVYVGPPDEGPTDADSRSGPTSTGRNPRDGANCNTCFDIDLRFVPQPHKDQNICSVGQVARHWIKSSDLGKNQTSCRSCRFLKSAFDILLNEGEVIDIPHGSEIDYSIAILDRNDSNSADEQQKRKRREAALAYETSNSLLIEMRCSAVNRSRGAKDDGFQEEFKVEIYTRPGGPSQAVF